MKLGGPGSIGKGVRGTLDVRQTTPTQLQIAEILDAIAKANAKANAK
jgi:hypothetical protein